MSPETPPPFRAFYDFMNRFVPISENEFDLLLPHLSLVSFKKRESLIDIGSRPSNLYFVQSGLLRVHCDSDSSLITADFLKETDFYFDFDYIFNQEPAGKGVECIEDSQLIQLPYSKLQSAYDHSHMMERLGRMMVERAFAKFVQIRKSAIGQPMDRLIEFEKNQPELIQRVPMKIVASFLGITPESLSRLKRRRRDLLRQNINYS